MEFKVEILGRMSFEEALIYQKKTVQKVRDQLIPSTFLLVEHPAVVPMGKRSSNDHILVSPENLEGQNIKVVPTDRGGLVTLHMPGQLVCYPIFDLKCVGMGIKPFVSFLADIIISFLNTFNINGYYDEKNPGVYVGDKKIASVGIRVDRFVTRHGFALNCFNNLKLFDYIVACGKSHQLFTSIKAEKTSSPENIQYYFDCLREITFRKYLLGYVEGQGHTQLEHDHDNILNKSFYPH